MVVTADVSQPLVSGLAAVALWNMYDISVTADVSQPLVSGFAAVALSNMCDMSVTAEKSGVSVANT